MNWIWLEIAGFESVSVGLNHPGLVHRRYITALSTLKT